MATGKVRWFNDARGYGFIRSEEVDNGERDIFVHYTEIVRNGYRSLEEGQIVEFDVQETPNGLQARYVRPMS